MEGVGLAGGGVRAQTPETETADEGVAIIAETGALWEARDAPCVAATEDDVIDDAGGAEDGDDGIDGFLPFFLAETPAALAPEHVLEGALRGVGEFAKLERDEHVIEDHGGAEAGAEAQEEHAAAFVAAEGLHGGVIDDLAGLAEGGVIIEIHPAAPEVVGLADGVVVDDGDGEAEGDGVVVPGGGMGMDAGH